MAAWNPRANELLVEALERPAGSQRESFLDDACQNDAELRQRVTSLLAMNAAAADFLSSPAEGLLTVSLGADSASELNSKIGPYTLVERLGEGGMGVVYLAEQFAPVRRTVAIKVVKRGMDSLQITTRFEAERQALALMEHPNIARVIDAGTTADGRPYFVMEAVRGEPITKYCDRRRLTPQKRLELFLLVCRAVHHAHQKGVIHRDLKPSNVLVAQCDGHATPKVIDFGVAKAVGPKLTDETLYTEYGAVIGTLEYMSPEQSEFNRLDIDTRSDIYSLGVMLYELLAGSTPVDRRRTSMALDQLLRAIREEEPRTPSAALAASEALPQVAAARSCEPHRLIKEVQGELDWIVMKALEKDRELRYESADSFAADIERRLRDEPVDAGPPSTMYRVRKYVRRHRAAAAGLIAAALSAAVALAAIGSAIGWAFRDRAARDEQAAHERAERQARVTGQLDVILEEATRLERAEKWSEALVAAKRAELLLATGDAVDETQKRAQRTLANLELVARLEEIRGDTGTWWGVPNPVFDDLARQADADYVAAFKRAGIDIDALPVDEAARQVAGHEEVAAAVLPAMDDWIAARSKLGDPAATKRLAAVLKLADPDPWRQQVRERLAAEDWAGLQRLAESADVERQPAASLAALCASLRGHSEGIVDSATSTPADITFAERGFDLELGILKRAQRRFPDDYWLNHRLGIALIWYGGENAKQGLAYMRAAVAARPREAHALMNLGTGFLVLNQLEDAIASYRRGVELNPKYGYCFRNLGVALVRHGDYDEAVKAFEQSIKLPAPNRAAAAADVHADLAMLLADCPRESMRDLPRALQLADEAIKLEPNWRKQWTALGMARYRSGQWQQAHDAFTRALDLRGNPLAALTSPAEVVDWWFLAMCSAHLGEQDKARQWQIKASQWMKDHGPPGPELTRYQTETDALIKASPGDDSPPA